MNEIKKNSLPAEPDANRASARVRSIAGMRFGRLTAIEPTELRRGRYVVWRCICDCGNEKLVSLNNLTGNSTKSCGCLALEARRSKASNLSGQRFGKLLAVEATRQRQNNSVVWRCLCDCGKETLCTANALVEGKVKSCGCSRQENDALKRSLDYVDGTCIQFINNSGKPGARNTSGCRGVSAFRGKWQARISFKKKSYHLGTFDNLEDAIRVRKQAEEELYGQFLQWYEQLKAH